MRLLHTTELRFQEFFDSDIPKYAILSHRWGPDEISYQEFMEIRKSYFKVCLELFGIDYLFPAEFDISVYTHRVMDIVTRWGNIIQYGVDLLVFALQGDVQGSLTQISCLLVIYYCSDWKGGMRDSASQTRRAMIAMVPTIMFLTNLYTGKHMSYYDVLSQLFFLTFPHYVHILWPKYYGDGYAKVLACCKYAAMDKTHGPFEWLWIDTCCIDKSSSSELSESINSMYRWYKEASVCYAYLADVRYIKDDDLAQTASCDQSARPSRIDISASAWFTRGWTLQELLAPRKLVFRDVGWAVIGNRSDPNLLPDITKVTGIPQQVILNMWLAAHVNIATKLTWAARRQTSRLEDSAYCLLGLLGISMPLLYGEGTNAFRRLQLELIRSTNDESIFTWGFPPSRPQNLAAQRRTGLIAPAQDLLFEATEEAKPNCTQDIPRPPYSITNQGLEVSIPADLARQTAMLLPLNYYHCDRHGIKGAYAIPLQRSKLIWERISAVSRVKDLPVPSDTMYRLEKGGLWIVPREWVWTREDLANRGSVVIYVSLESLEHTGMRWKN